MLPSILHIANEHNLTSDPKTFGKKESYFKCPFCEQDSLPENKDKYYLSLNPDGNVFKCWYCKKGGGVLHFESLLTNTPYKDIRKKYFGERKNAHPANNLSPDQLNRIGWRDKKRKDFKTFNKNRDLVLKEWNEFMYEELVKHSALFTLIAHFPFKEQQKSHYKWFAEICQESEVDNLRKRIVSEWKKTDAQAEWLIEGKELARIAYRVSLNSGDFEFQNLFVSIFFVYEQLVINGYKKVSV